MFNQFYVVLVPSHRLHAVEDMNLVRLSRLLVLFHINPLLVTVQAMFLFCGARSATGNDPRYRSLHGSLLQPLRIGTMPEIISMVIVAVVTMFGCGVWVKEFPFKLQLQVMGWAGLPQMVQTYFFCIFAR